MQQARVPVAELESIAAQLMSGGWPQVAAKHPVTNQPV
jgi:hypothetical protein